MFPESNKFQFKYIQHQCSIKDLLYICGDRSFCKGLKIEWHISTTVAITFNGKLENDITISELKVTDLQRFLQYFEFIILLQAIDKHIINAIIKFKKPENHICERIIMQCDLGKA